MADVNLLFLSVGRRVELMRLFGRAYGRLGIDGRVVGLDIDPLAPALQAVDVPLIVPRLDDPGFVPQLLSICRRERIACVFPLIDPDIAVLARNRAAIEATGAGVAAVEASTLGLANDKWRTTELFQRLGLPAPRSWLADAVDPDTATYPLFIKPRWGSAGVGASRVDDADALRYALAHVSQPIIQECLPGPEITNDVICDLQGQVAAVVSRQRIEVRWGEVAKGVTMRDERIIDACRRVAEALPARGPITVQCMMRGETPCFTEINARLGGGVPLADAAGVDFATWLLAQAAGLDFALPPLGQYREGLYLTRSDTSLFLTQEQYDDIARRHL